MANTSPVPTIAMTNRRLRHCRSRSAAISTSSFPAWGEGTDPRGYPEKASTNFAQKAGRSSGLRLDTSVLGPPVQTITSWSTQSHPRYAGRSAGWART